VGRTRTGRANFVQSLGIDSKTEGSLNTRTKGLSITEREDTIVVDLGLEERSSIEVSFSTNLKADTLCGGLGVVDSLGTSLDVGGHAVVVARSKGVQVAKTVEGNSVLGRAEANSSGVLGDAALSDVVGSLGAEQETVTANDSVSGEGWSLEEVKEGTCVETGLLVDGRDNDSLLRAFWEKGSVQVELETLGKVVLGLNGGAEDVRGGPSLGEDKTVRLVRELGLNVTIEIAGLGILATSNLEGDVGRSGGLDLESCRNRI